MQACDTPDLSYLEGGSRDDYLHDMRLCQNWAKLNRSLIVGLIMDYLAVQGNTDMDENRSEALRFGSIHNCIGSDNIICRRAISAYEGQKGSIPLNMRDGSLICVGKGNDDWNCFVSHDEPQANQHGRLPCFHAGHLQRKPYRRDKGRITDGLQTEGGDHPQHTGHGVGGERHYTDI